MTELNGHTAPIDPSAAVNRDRVPSLPKRFYRDATVGAQPGGYALLLDGRGARTPARKPIVLPTEALGRQVAAEWSAVGAEIDPRAMPFTRFVNSVIDGVSVNQADVLAEIVRYAGSDLIVYRAAEPPDLLRLQEEAWNPLVDWYRVDLGASLRLATGIVFVEQSASTLQRLEAAVRTVTGQDAGAAFRLAAIHVMTTLTGSALIALAVASGRLFAEDAWAAAHVDEDYQAARWGQDEDAAARREARWTDMRTAATLFGLASEP